MKSVTIKLDITADDLDGAMRAIKEELDRRDVPDDGKRIGLIGKSIDPHVRYGMMWSYDERLGSRLAVGYHPAAIVPPATVLQPRGVVYCGIGVGGNETLFYGGPA